MEIILKWNGKVIRKFDHYADATRFIDAQSDSIQAQFEIIEKVKYHGKKETETNN